MGAFSDIYYKIYSTKVILDSRQMIGPVNARCRRIYDVYLTCIKQKDFRNAMKMLHYYEEYGKENQALIDLCYAELYIKLSQFKKAEVYLRRCERNHSENPRYYILCAELYYKKKEYAKAVRLTPWIEKYDGHMTTSIYQLLAESDYLVGDEDEMRRMCRILETMVGGKERYEKNFPEIQRVALKNQITEYPTNRNYLVSFQIALDEEDWDNAIFYLNILEGRQKNELDAQNGEKLKRHLKIKMKEKGVQSED